MLDFIEATFTTMSPTTVAIVVKHNKETVKTFKNQKGVRKTAKEWAIENGYKVRI